MAFVTGTDTRIDRETRGWRLAVGSGILGWVLDSFDFFVMVFLFDTLAGRFHVPKSSVVYTLTLTLAMRPLGALFFGSLADRFGRKRPLIVCILYFSLCTVLSGLAPSFAMFVICRALYGIGIGIVLAIVYWIAMSVSAAMGSGGLVPPMLAAWAPNILFGAAAAYMILTVRT